MSQACELRVYENGQLVGSVDVSGRVEIGRHDPNLKDPEPTSSTPVPRNFAANPPRIIVAGGLDRRVSRKHVQLEFLATGKVKVTNVSEARAVRFYGGEELPRQGDNLEADLPIGLMLGNRVVRVQPLESGSGYDRLESLAGMTMAPRSEADFATLGTIPLAPSNLEMPVGGMDVENLARWLQGAMGVLHSAAGSADFYRRAARALVDLVRLDSGRVLTRDGNEWRVLAVQVAPGRRAEAEWQPSRRIMNRLVEEKKTFWQVPPEASGHMESLQGIKAVVASPILDRAGNVCGALYGDRRQDGLQAGKPITRLEALLVDLLASGVAAGQARLDQEEVAKKAQAEADRVQVQMENFFTPKVARVLAAQPELLEGRDTDVTILFCDIRGFSRVSERLGPAGTVRWINSVMGALSECILEHEGVVVDYIGDELMAMWGAPEPQVDHAVRAVRAALSMLERLPAISQEWSADLQETMDLGIGINTGKARVGNVGSRFKFKYGPLGNTVNLASRVQGANKYLKTRVLLTGNTFRLLNGLLPVRRVGAIRVVNIHEPTTLYEPVGALGPKGNDLKLGYEDALAFFERKEFLQTTRILGRLMPDYPTDGPSLVLMSRAVQCLVEEPEHFDPVWELPGK